MSEDRVGPLPTPPCGVLVLDKPTGVSSFEVVRVVRRLLSTRRVGHTGTLDPMASGVLSLCVGEATKIAQYLIDGDKVYLAQAQLGWTTNTWDNTGAMLTRHPEAAARVTRSQLEQALGHFRGTVKQVPPAFSAIHVHGKRAYALARAGAEVELAARTVEVHELELLTFEDSYFNVRIRCSKGTYVRSLLFDVGQRLGCGATMTALRRERSGPFAIEQSLTLAEAEQRGQLLANSLRSIDEALPNFAPIEIDVAACQALRQGQSVSDAGEDLEPVRIRCAGKLVALGRRCAGKLIPTRVFVTQP